jgi:hypothetical protein
MLCTAIGCPAPIVVLPMRTDRVGLRSIAKVKAPETKDRESGDARLF